MKNENTNQLQVIVEQSGLEQNKVQELLSHFGTDFNEARQVAEASKGIVVTAEDQIEQMAEARKARLSLQKIRVRVEHTRKQLKEQALREGKAIDGAANIIKAIIIPIEEHLEKQEKFAEEMAKKRSEERLATRRELLTPYVDDISVFDLSGMHEDTFQKLLENSKAAKKAQEEAERKAEEERIEAQKKDQLHYSRKDQLIPYWTFLTPDQVQLNLGDLSEKDFNKLLADVKALQKADAEKRLKEQKENERLRLEQEKRDEELRKEREAREKLEKEAQAKKEAEEKAKREEEARIAQLKAEAEEAERQRLLAPDKEKLLSLAAEIAKIEMPTVQSEKAKKAVQDIRGMLGRLDEFIKQRSRTL